jgi:large subunit ribosomal protein L13|tara:strand:- start:6 stop:458 length:453 start_codon:yes stop_codon:yes gene_type:complete
LKANSFKTLSIRKEDVQKKWLLVDASEQNLGRMCSKVAKILRGKHKVSFTPHIDCGDNVVIINASKINLTGKKWTDKEYISYTGYPGGQRVKTAQQIFDKNPSILIEKAIKGMLPKNKLGAAIFRNLRVYNDDLHNQEAQNPEMIDLKDL